MLEKSIIIFVELPTDPILTVKFDNFGSIKSRSLAEDNFVWSAIECIQSHIFWGIEIERGDRSI
jgi:hypothetical protein